MLSHLDNYDIVLASNSPRRKELFATLDISFRVFTLPNIDESYPSHLRGRSVAEYIAAKKAAAYRETLTSNSLLLTADTIVCIDDEVLGKPKDFADAQRMLRLLSGREHRVVTAVSLNTQQWQRQCTTETLVSFANLSDSEIDYYIQHYKPFDKAGAYGIQEWIGATAIVGIEGSYFNVVGLPVQQVYQLLRQVPPR